MPSITNYFSRAFKNVFRAADPTPFTPSRANKLLAKVNAYENKYGKAYKIRSSERALADMLIKRGWLAHAPGDKVEMTQAGHAVLMSNMLVKAKSSKGAISGGWFARNSARSGCRRP